MRRRARWPQCTHNPCEAQINRLADYERAGCAWRSEGRGEWLMARDPQLQRRTNSPFALSLVVGTDVVKSVVCYQRALWPRGATYFLALPRK